MRTQCLILSLLLPMLTCTVARADTTLVFEQTGGADATAQKQPIYIGKGRIRFDGGLPHNYVLFDTKTRTMTRVDEQNRTYVRIDEKTLDSIAAAVKSAQTEAMAQMKNLPPEQQEQMRAMMQKMAPAGAAPTVEPVREVPSSKTLTIDGRTCQVAASYRGDQKVADLCTVSPTELGMSTQDFAALQAFQQFTLRMASKFPAGSHELELGDPEARHIPVQVIQYGPDAHEIVTKLASVSHKAIAASQFEVPNGYQEQQVMQPVKGQ